MSKKKTKLNLSVTKEENLGQWFQEVLKKSDMIKYYDVAGCYILLPWCFSIWEFVQRFLDDEMKLHGVQNCYFPLFVSKSALETEKDHLNDFSPEVAWVTRAGSSELEEPIAIRPTSETIMYPAYAEMIRNEHDLPLKLNQWTNVVRWEFSKTTPLLRSREFLWQEGHAAYATQQEAEEEVVEMLDLYARAYEDMLAVPVIKGRKSDKEKFAGADFSTTVEAFIPVSGRAVQGGTSHCLGQNFSKMFKIKYTSQEHGMRYVWQNSWGFTTRSVGVMAMVHGDDKGLVLPPRVAPIQIVIIPIRVSKAKSGGEDVGAAINERILEVEKILKAEVGYNFGKGLRVKADLRKNKTAGWKYNHWEQKGVPVRIEIGDRERKENKLCLALRHSGEKIFIDFDANVGNKICEVLARIQTEMLEKARKVRDDHISIVFNFDDFIKELDAGNLVLAPWCLTIKSETWIKEETKRIFSTDAEAEKAGRVLTGAAKSLCIPFFQDPLDEGTKCFTGNGEDAKKWCLFGRSY
eukprot:maker-scaffold_24-snap-gene-2.6-mRNA-1 protein AED:0.01 eAED:0.01 QI:224/1/1/1/1/1/3/408/520